MPESVRAGVSLRPSAVAAAALAATVFAAVPAAHADSLVGGFTAPGFYGQANTTDVEWEGFTSPTGPNPATAETNAATADWVDTTAATDGAFLISNPPSGPGQPGSDIYSFSGILTPEITLPNLNLGAAYTTTVVFQIQVDGAELDTSSVSLLANGQTLLPTDITLVSDIPSDTAFGEADQDVWEFVWTGIAGNAAAYTIDYSAGNTSVAQQDIRIDTLATLATSAAATPEPTPIDLLAITGLLSGGVGLVRRRLRAGKARS